MIKLFQEHKPISPDPSLVQQQPAPASEQVLSQAELAHAQVCLSNVWLILSRLTSCDLAQFRLPFSPPLSPRRIDFIGCILNWLNKWVHDVQNASPEMLFSFITLVIEVREYAN